MKKITALSLILLMLFCALPFVAAEEYPLTVYFLDVWQGDCALVVADGEAMLIDGGGNEYASIVYRFLKDHEIRKLKYMVVSHPDDDHISGLLGAFYTTEIETVLCPVKEKKNEKANSPLGIFKRMLNRFALSITVPTAGDTYMLGNACVQVLMPIEGAKTNDNSSIVLRISYGEHSFLFMGDSEKKDEKALLATGTELKSTVLKVGHHGSSTSTTMDFLKAVSPTYAVISAGRKNPHNHPTEKTLRALKSRSVILYRTDIQGTVICQSNGKTITFSVEKNATKNTYAYAGGYKGQ